jgi:two-component system NtrC family response regulator
VLTATNKPVSPAEPGCVLREDLYYRLAVVEIKVPPLRVRRSDIPLLVTHALRSTTARAVSEQAMEQLLSYDWPGNVRELIHVVERASVLCGGEIIDTGHLPEAVTRNPVAADVSESGTLHEAVARLERKMILVALERAKGNRSEAARQLGVARAQLYAKMEEHGIGGKGESG